MKVKAYIYTIAVEDAGETMGVVIPVPDRVLAAVGFDPARDIDPMIPSAVQATLQRDRPELLGKPWVRLSRKLQEWIWEPGAPDA